MTAEWIRKAAEEKYPWADGRYPGESAVLHAFIAGVELGLAKAAEVAVGGFDPLAHCCEDCSVYSERWKIAAAIRALGSDEKNEEE